MYIKIVSLFYYSCTCYVYIYTIFVVSISEPLHETHWDQPGRCAMKTGMISKRSVIALGAVLLAAATAYADQGAPVRVLQTNYLSVEDVSSILAANLGQAAHTETYWARQSGCTV